MFTMSTNITFLFFTTIFVAVFVAKFSYFSWNEISHVNKYMLILGILSAPNNFENRESIRKTWLTTTDGLSAKHYFLIGNPCEVDVLDRKNKFGCEQRNYSLFRDSKEDFEISSATYHDLSPPTNNKHEVYTGFGFTTNFKIVVHKLGVLANVLQKVDTPIKVQLKSQFDNSVIASVTFNPTELHERSGFVYKNIPPVVLPFNFEGIVVLESFGDEVEGEHFMTNWNDTTGVIDFTELWLPQALYPTQFHNDSVVAVSFVFSIYEFQKTKETVVSLPVRLNSHRHKCQELSKLLLEEQEKYKDILVLEVIDVYVNLKRKVLEFFKRSLLLHDFEYILKTDDDTFIDLPRVYNELKTLSGRNCVNYRKSEFCGLWWWSSLRENWEVQKSGKWKETNYHSVTYPPFPCGAGYVLNKNVVSYLASNAELLQMYQGEDVSLGIWLSALVTEKYQGRRNKEMTCDWTCDNERRQNVPACNKVQLSVPLMYETWENYLNNGRIT